MLKAIFLHKKITHFFYAIIIFISSFNLSSFAPRTDRQLAMIYQKDTENHEQTLGFAVNYADMANFSHYVNRKKLKDIASFKELKNNKINSNFRIQGEKFGHYLSTKSYRAKNLKKTIFHNFSFESMRSHSVDAHHAHWTNFYISGSISDWEFQNATLENGWFNAQMKNCDFRGAHLRNVGFYGAKLTKTHNILKLGKGINFDGATLENVTFTGSALKRASFKGAVFLSNIKFQEANVHFVSQFTGSKFVDNSGKEHIITKDQVDKLHKNLQKDEKEKSITSDDIINIVKQ